MGVHGREQVICMTSLALMLSLLPASLSAQPPSPFQDLAGELASRIASALPRGQQVMVAAADGAELDALRTEIARTLNAGGFRVVDAGAPTVIRLVCFDNVRERGCVADIRTGDARDAVAVTRPLEPLGRRTSPLSFDVRPLFEQRTQILDVALVRDRLLVLDPEAVTLYRSSDGGWQRVQARRIETGRTWPRDVRGRIQVGPESAVRILLPGVTCRTTTDLVSVVCAEEREPWPLDIENTGLDGTRNHFSTPEGLTFFNAAALDAPAGARWIVADVSGGLTLLDASRRRVAAVAPADDVVALKPSCAAETVVVTVSSRERRRDVLRASRVWRRELIPAAVPVELSGQLTALWRDAETTAIAIVRSEDGQRYDAFHISLACDR